MGARAAGNEIAKAWCAEQGDHGSEGTFADAAGFGELVVNCINGNGTVAAVTSAATELAGKVLVEVSNPLDFSSGGPSLSVAITDSLGEQVQRALPETFVVKALNTVNCDVMVDPVRVPGDHAVFVSGNDANAKSRVIALLGEFGWPADRVLDIGDITAARTTEAYMLIWLRMMNVVGDSLFNIEIRRHG
jgi:predicted dinucleotide-binding enzyme